MEVAAKKNQITFSARGIVGIFFGELHLLNQRDRGNGIF
jgi:hypothetical protein